MKFVYDKGMVDEEDRAIFTVATRSGAPVLRKVLPPDNEENAFHLPFVFEETAAMRPDTYEWSLRVVHGGELDENGRIVSANSSQTAILKGRLTIMSVPGGAR